MDCGVSEIVQSDAEVPEQVSEGDGLDNRKREQLVNVPRQLVGGFVDRLPADIDCHAFPSSWIVQLGLHSPTG